MPRAVIPTAQGFQDHDAVIVYYSLLWRGWEVDVATHGGRPVTGKYGIPLPMDKHARPNVAFEELDPDHYDAVFCIGGHEAPDRVRQEQLVLDFVAAMHAQGKLVAGLCHGPWIMISAGLMAGRTACAYPGLRVDMVHAGATVLDERVVVDENVVTSSYYGFGMEFMEAALAAVAA